METKIERLIEKINCSLGKERADLVIKNATILNVFSEQFEKTDIAIKGGVIVGLGSYEGEEEVDASDKYVVPSFIDGHVHLESSIISPMQFAKAVIPHGTTAVVSDPHEITNVLGKKGFTYMLNATKDLLLDVFLTVPSCVPATCFDEAGAEITEQDVKKMLSFPRVLGLAEMMNFSGVVNSNEQVLRKLIAASSNGGIIDGHAPLLSGRELNAYLTAGAKSDHECTNFGEALTKLKLGQWIMVREGTASKNLEALIPLFDKPYCDRCMLVTDDKHPRELVEEGEIDHIVRKAISLGVNTINAYKMASFNPARYFGFTDRGAIAPNYLADFIILEDINEVKIHSVYKRGKRVDKICERLTLDSVDLKGITDTVRIKNVTAESFALKKKEEKVIGLVAGQILTTDEGCATKVDIDKDICKLAVVERHKGSGRIGVAFVKGYGLKRGAIATSVAHDSHNIIVVGTNDQDMAFAVMRIKELKGGMVVVNEGKVLSELALPIAGIMCDLSATECAEKLKEVKNSAYLLGVNKEIDPFMTLSFSSLPVIPSLRLTTLGVVDVDKFTLLD